MSRRVMAYFSSSSCVDLTVTTATDDAEAPAKGGLEDEAADGTAGLTDFSTPLPRRADEVAPLLHRHQSSSMSLTNQQASTTAIDK